MDNKKYASLNTLKIFLDNCRNIFSNISHTHIKDEIVDFDEQDIVDKVIEQLPVAEDMKF